MKTTFIQNQVLHNFGVNTMLLKVINWAMRDVFKPIVPFPELLNLELITGTKEQFIPKLERELYLLLN